MPSARRAPLALLTALALVLGVSLPVTQQVAPAAAAGTASVVGTVVGPDGPVGYVPGVQAITILVHPVGSPTSVASARTDETGAFAIHDVPVGTYQISARYFGPDNVLSTWLPGVQRQTVAQQYTLAEGTEHTIDLVLRRGAAVSGTITLEGGGFGLQAQIAQVSGTWPDDINQPRLTSDPADGSYVIERIAPGTYTVSAYASFDRYWNVQWPSRWGGEGTVTPITLDFGEVRSEIDFELPFTSTIQGTITVPPGSPSLSGQEVVLRKNGSVYNSDMLSSDGRFEFTGITGDGITVCTFHRPEVAYFSETCWHPELGVSGDRQPFSMDRTDRYVDVSIPLRTGGRVVVDAKYGDPVVSPGGWFSGDAILYRLNDADGYWYAVDQVTADDNPYYGERSFTIPAVEPGEYRLELVTSGVFAWYGRVYYPGTRRWADAGSFTVSEFQTTDLGMIFVPDKEFEIDRFSGDDRYGTAVEISKNTRVDPPVPVVYIASGAGYPDALSAGPAAAAQGGVLLLTPPTGLTPALRDELSRLDPERIVVAGGTGSVSRAVEIELRSFVDAPELVTRIGGADRYETSRLIVDDAFGGTTGRVAFIATGLNFPDALAAGPAAAHFAGPVILVRGSLSSLDAPTRALLDVLQPGAIVIAGGTGTVSAGIESSLTSRYGTRADIIRAPGRDRFETATIINMISFAEAESAVFASGTGFADALAGGTLAASMQAPLYLVRKNCVPEFVRTHIDDLGVFEVRILGGLGVLDASIDTGSICTG